MTTHDLCDCEGFALPNSWSLTAVEKGFFTGHRRADARSDEPSKSKAKKPSCRLTRLPLEIREMIYAAHFNQDQEARKSGTKCPAGSACPHRVFYKHVPVRALFLVSKTICNESVPMYYRSKDFFFHNLHTMTRFLGCIGAWQRSFVTQISFIYRGRLDINSYGNEGDAVEAFRALTDCPALRTLRIGSHCESLPFNKDRKCSLMSALDLDELLRVRGLMTVDLVVDDPKHLLKDVEEFKGALQVMKLPRKVSAEVDVPRREEKRTRRRIVEGQKRGTVRLLRF